MLDFIEFFKNEEMYQRQIVFDGEYFKVGKDCIFKWDKKTTLVYPTTKSGYPLRDQYDEYTIKQRIYPDGMAIYYILKSDYFSGYYFEFENNVVKIKTKEISDDDLQFLTEKVKTDNKKIRKNTVFSAIAGLIIVAIGISYLIYIFNYLRGEGILSSCTSFVQTISENGTYYLKRAYTNELDSSTYIKLNGGRWEDSDGLSGTYKISNGNITFYINDNVFLQGSINAGTIQIEAFSSYMTYVRR